MSSVAQPSLAVEPRTATPPSVSSTVRGASPITTVEKTTMCQKALGLVKTVAQYTLGLGYTATMFGASKLLNEESSFLDKTTWKGKSLKLFAALVNVAMLYSVGCLIAGASVLAFAANAAAVKAAVTGIFA